MKKASIIMAGLACAIIAAAYTNSVPISTNTRAATEKWTAIRFEPALPPTPANAASKFLDGNREWQTVSADQIGALTNETDEAALAALAAYSAYWPPNATASSWFSFTTNSGAITITGYNIGGGTDVVIPDYINGLPVTEIGANAFAWSGVTSIGGAGNVVTVGEAAFNYCTSLTSASLPQVHTVGNYVFSACQSLSSVSLPQVQTVGDYAFASCTSLTSASLPQVQTVGDYAFDFCGGLTSLYFDNDAPTTGIVIFENITPNQVTNYVTNPQATGWGATFAGMPVVRLPLSADAIYQAGELVATTGHVAQAIAAIPGSDLSDYTTFPVVSALIYSNSVSHLMIYTNSAGAATSWWSVARGVTNSGTFASDGGSVSGAITNGQLIASIGGLNVIPASGKGSITIDSDGGGNGYSLSLTENRIYVGSGYNDGQHGLQLQPFGGHVGIGSLFAREALDVVGNVVASGTNTAAEVRTLGGYSIFDSGSNCYWRVTASNGTFYASDTNGVRKFKFTTETP